MIILKQWSAWRLAKQDLDQTAWKDRWYRTLLCLSTCGHWHRKCCIPHCRLWARSTLCPFVNLTNSTIKICDQYEKRSMWTCQGSGEKFSHIETAVSHPFCPCISSILSCKTPKSRQKKNKASSVVVSTPASRPTNAVHVFDWAFSCSMWMEEYMTSLPCNNSGIALHYADLRNHSCLMLQLLLSYAWRLKWRLEATGCASDVLVKLSCVQTADTKRVSSWWEWSEAKPALSSSRTLRRYFRSRESIDPVTEYSYSSPRGALGGRWICILEVFVTWSWTEEGQRL